MDVWNNTDMELIDLAKWFNPTLKVWINYYGKFFKTAWMNVLGQFEAQPGSW